MPLLAIAASLFVFHLGTIVLVNNIYKSRILNSDERISKHTTLTRLHRKEEAATTTTTMNITTAANTIFFHGSVCYSLLCITNICLLERLNHTIKAIKLQFLCRCKHKNSTNTDPRSVCIDRHNRKQTQMIND